MEEKFQTLKANHSEAEVASKMEKRNHTDEMTAMQDTMQALKVDNLEHAAANNDDKRRQKNEMEEILENINGIRYDDQEEKPQQQDAIGQLQAEVRCVNTLSSGVPSRTSKEGLQPKVRNTGTSSSERKIDTSPKPNEISLAQHDEKWKSLKFTLRFVLHIYLICAIVYLQAESQSCGKGWNTFNFILA